MKRNTDTMMKESIFTEGIKLFLQKGFRGTTIEDITNSVNITKGAFYWHFESKNELLQSIVERYDKIFVDEFIKIINSFKGNFLSKFNYYHKYITEFAFHNRDLCVGFMTLSAELAGSGSEIERRINTIYLKHRGFLKALIELGKREDIISNDLDSDIAVHVIIAINNGMLLEWYMNQNSINGQLFAKTYRDITLQGILKK